MPEPTLFDLPDGRKPWQRSALENTDPHHLARTSDPTTSARAAASIAPRTGTYKRLLFDAIAASGDGLTFEEAARRVGMDPWQASKRVSDLKRDGLIVVVGERPGTSGKAQEVCLVAEQVSA